MVDFENDIKNCVAIIEKGGVVLYPTDTIWGLGCDAMNEDAAEKIYEIKQRPKQKSLLVLLAEPKDILQYIAAPHPDIIDILEHFMQPTTVVYDHPLGFPANILADNGTIALRVTNDPFCKALIKRLKKPIVSTSANISGYPAAASFKDINKYIISRVDYVVKYRQEEDINNHPSRLVRIQEDGSLDILRP